MNILVVGAGGVGAAVAAIAARRSYFDRMVLADIDLERATRAAGAVDDPRFAGERVDATDRADIVALARRVDADVILNACDPRFNPPIFDAAFEMGATYLDMAMHLSHPHPERPHELTGVKLGDEQFAVADLWAEKGQLAVVGIGVEPGLSDVFARYAADHLFTSVDEVNVRDGANLEIDGYAFAPTFSIWTTIEECLNPPVIWERDRGWYTTAPFSEPEVFDFPDGIGPVECVNVEHEEVLLVPRWIDCNRVTFKYGLGDEFIEVLEVLHKTGLDGTRSGEGAGRRGVAARRGGGHAAQPGRARTPDARQDLRRHLGHRHRRRRVTPIDLPLPRGRQPGLHARLRPPGRRVADGDQPGDRHGAAGRRLLAGRGRARTRGVRRRALPRQAGRVRQSVGPTRAERLTIGLTASAPRSCHRSSNTTGTSVTEMAIDASDSGKPTLVKSVKR